MQQDEEWGPWVAHDGRALPPIARGTIVEVQFASGHIRGGVAGAKGDHPAPTKYDGPTYANAWVWRGSGTRIPIIKYRIRQFRALAELRALIADLRVDA